LPGTRGPCPASALTPDDVKERALTAWRRTATNVRCNAIIKQLIPLSHTRTEAMPIAGDPGTNCSGEP
jgi:hypothetical protein